MISTSPIVPGIDSLANSAAIGPMVPTASRIRFAPCRPGSDRASGCSAAWRSCAPTGCARWTSRDIASTTSKGSPWRSPGIGSPRSRWPRGSPSASISTVIRRPSTGGCGTAAWMAAARIHENLASGTTVTRFKGLPEHRLRASGPSRPARRAQQPERRRLADGNRADRVRRWRPPPRLHRSCGQRVDRRHGAGHAQAAAQRGRAGLRRLLPPGRQHALSRPPSAGSRRSSRARRTSTSPR